jgi:hypothetical protein
MLFSSSLIAVVGAGEQVKFPPLPPASLSFSSTWKIGSVFQFSFKVMFVGCCNSSLFLLILQLLPLWVTQFPEVNCISFPFP